jgi:uncharacterized membrane protein (UPF0127 family)
MTPPPRIDLLVGTHHLRPWLAATSASCERGLMHVEAFPPDGGMLLAYPEPCDLWVWMRNTPVPLSVAFLDAHRRIVGLADLDPYSERKHHPPVPAQFALETHRGWFRMRGVGLGQQVRFALPRTG